MLTTTTFDFHPRIQPLDKADKKNALYVCYVSATHRLEVADVDPRAGRLRGVAAGAHAGVVSEPALVQVGVVERL